MCSHCHTKYIDVFLTVPFSTFFGLLYSYIFEYLAMLIILNIFLAGNDKCIKSVLSIEYTFVYIFSCSYINILFKYLQICSYTLIVIP